MVLSSALIAIDTPNSAMGQVGVPIVGLWSDTYFASNVTDANLSPPGQVIFQLNVTGAPEFNAFEFVLYYDPAVIRAVSTDTTGTMCVGEFPPFKDENLVTLGTVRVSVAQLGGACSGSDGTLIHINFNIIAVGVSPLTLAAGIANPTGFQQSWTRLTFLAEPIIVETSDGYFKNEPVKLGPVAEFSFSPSSPEEGDNVTFNATDSYDLDNISALNKGIREYRWDFGEGSSFATNQSIITHIFASISGQNFTGSFSVRLTVSDADNAFLGMRVRLVTVTERALHDVEIFSVAITPAVANPGENVSVTVLVRNRGTFNETYSMRVQYSVPITLLGTVPNRNIISKTTQNFTFTMDTTNLDPGYYTVEAEATTTGGDDNLSNNIDRQILRVPYPTSARALYIAAGAAGVLGTVVALGLLLKRNRGKPYEE